MILRKLKKNNCEVLLGLALGLGYLTNFRFFGPVGISEVMFLMVFLMLLKAHLKDVFYFKLGKEQYINFFVLVTFLLVLPITTMAVFYSDLETSSPVYLLSYIIGSFLVLLLFFAQKKNFDFRLVTIIFAVTFIVSNLFFLIGYGGAGRYSGGASNPNQLLFYGTSLSLFISIYLKKLQFVFFPVLFFIMLKTGSDAYNLSIFIALSFFLLAHVVFYSKFSLFLGLLLGCIGAVMILISSYSFLLPLLSSFWHNADEGGTRITLFGNAIDVIKEGLFFGFGAGSFSGLTGPFQGKEAHNTFLDLATQFGIFLPLLIYGLMVAYFFKMVKERKFWVAGFVVAYIVGTMFHFSGRHFVFWVEIAIFYFSCFNKHIATTSRL